MAIRALKVPSWKRVQIKLMSKTDEADKVIHALLEYTTAVVDLRDTEEQEREILERFDYKKVTLDTFIHVQEKWQELMLIHIAIREKNKRCNRFAIVLGRLLVKDYPRRWVLIYEDQEHEYEDKHELIEIAYERMADSYYEMEEAYAWVRLMYDN